MPWEGEAAEAAFEKDIIPTLSEAEGQESHLRAEGVGRDASTPNEFALRTRSTLSMTNSDLLHLGQLFFQQLLVVQVAVVAV